MDDVELIDRMLRQRVQHDCAALDLIPKVADGGGAVFTEDMKYRYVLYRRWAVGIGVHFCMLNPATADEVKNDPTIRRCIGFAKAWGYPCVEMTNLFAYRSSDPHAMIAQSDPVGALNDDFIRATALRCNRTIVAWGAWGSVTAAPYRGSRGSEVLDLLSLHDVTPYHLGLTQRGQPKHPLYLRADTEPVEWKWKE